MEVEATTKRPSQNGRRRRRERSPKPEKRTGKGVAVRKFRSGLQMRGDRWRGKKKVLQN